jgi:hypothetical protein
MGEVKRFGANERPESQEFELVTFTDDGSEKIHKFNLVPIVPAGNVTALMDALDEEAEKSFGLMAKLLSRLLDNTDGTPARWVFEEYTEKGRKMFIGPDNEPHSVDAPERFRWEDINNGSSRRRWQWLMDPNNEEEAVRLNDMVDIAKWVVSEAIDRPTPARRSSTRASRRTPR